jgi:2-C-methyl-D-erythritol 4-phosphate cytidylyltransferase
MEYSAVIVAAGSGSRMGLGYNKVYAKLADGRTILETTVSVFSSDPDCRQIIVVTDPLEFRHHFAKRMPGRIVLCRGGKTRQESVANGLEAVISPYVLIHDGARPYLSKKDLDNLKKALETEKAALLMVPCKDTIKRVIDGYVETTYDRSTLMAAQTPQGFETSLILSCLCRAVQEGYTGTDDASLVERYGNVKVKAVAGSYGNFKITTPEDLSVKS